MSGRKFTQKQRKRLAEIAAKTPRLQGFDDTSPRAVNARVRKATGEGWEVFEFFCKTYFPHIFDKPFCADHRLMFEEVEKAKGVTAITGFRGFGKTMLIIIARDIWKVIKGKKFMVHVASDIELSNMKVTFIANQIRHNNRLAQDFPDLQILSAEESKVVLKNKAIIMARSIKQGIRGLFHEFLGTRPDEVKADDIDAEANIGSPKIGKRKLDKITQEIAGALNPDGDWKVVWAGNLVHPNYAISQFAELIYAEIREENPGFDPGHQKVISSHGKALIRVPLEDSEGNSVWPEQYPTEDLPKLRRQFGTTGYQREMLGRPVIEGNIFKNEWFQKYRFLPPAPGIRSVWLYADPAWGEKGCYKGIVSLAYDGSRWHAPHIWVRQTKNTMFFRFYYDAFMELGRRYGARFRASMETTYGQSRILEDFDRWCRDNGLKPISHLIKRVDNKENKHLRIERTETTIETGKVLFPDGQDTHIMISQFLTYPDGYIDGPDALAGCLERFSEYDSSRHRVRVRSLRT